MRVGFTVKTPGTTVEAMGSILLMQRQTRSSRSCVHKLCGRLLSAPAVFCSCMFSTVLKVWVKAVMNKYTFSQSHCWSQIFAPITLKHDSDSLRHEEMCLRETRGGLERHDVNTQHRKSAARVMWCHFHFICTEDTKQSECCLHWWLLCHHSNRAPWLKHVFPDKD